MGIISSWLREGGDGSGAGAGHALRHQGLQHDGLRRSAAMKIASNGNHVARNYKLK